MAKKKNKSINTKNINTVEHKNFSVKFIFENILLFGIVFLITYCISNLLFNYGNAFYYVFPLSAAFISVAMRIISIFITPESKASSYIYIVLSAFILSLSMLSVLAAYNMVPFGDNTIVTLDIKQQYIPFNMKLKDMIANGENFLYSHDLGLGGDFYGLFTYYLSSIYNIIMLIFPKSMFIFSYSLMTYLKFVTIPITFGIFYQKTFKRKDFTVVIFSLAYSLMSYIVIHTINIMWIDCIILFPLLIMYFNEMLETGVFWKYTVVLTLAMLSCYYIAYMICIYLVLYYIAYEFINTNKFILKEQLKKLWKFTYSSVLAAGAASIILIPAIYNLSKTANLNDLSTNGMKLWNYNPLMFFKQFFYYIKPGYLTGEMPNVYCSILILFLLTFFWSCKDIPWKKRLSYSVIFLFISFSLSFYPIDTVWHGFHDPVELPGRYSFLVSFTMIIMAIEVINNIKSLNLKALLIELIFIPLMISVLFLNDPNNLLPIFGTALLLITYTALMILYKKDLLKKQTALMISLLLVFSEMTTSAVISRKAPHDKYYKTNITDEIININDIFKEILENDTGIYRIENIQFNIYNQGAFTGAKTLTYFSSTNNGKIVNFMNNIGYCTNKINTYACSYYIPFPDSILGLKYLVFINRPFDSPYLKFLYQKTDGDLKYYIYENKLFTGLGYSVPNEITSWDINTDDPFECQNRLTRILVGKDLYKKVPIDFNVEGLTVKDDGSVYFDENYDTVDFNINIEWDGNYYFYHNIRKSKTIEVIKSDGDGITYLNNNNNNFVISLDEIKAGENIEIYVEEGKGSADCYIYKINEEVLSEAIEKINTTHYEIDTFENTYIKGSINMKENGIMFLSIVNDGDWTATVDGKETEITEIADCFIGIPLEAGEHTIEFHYHNYSVLIGALVTLLSIGIIIFIALIQKKKKTN